MKQHKNPVMEHSQYVIPFQFVIPKGQNRRNYSNLGQLLEKSAFSIFIAGLFVPYRFMSQSFSNSAVHHFFLSLSIKG